MWTTLLPYIYVHIQELGDYPFPGQSGKLVERTCGGSRTRKTDLLLCWGEHPWLVWHDIVIHFQCVFLPLHVNTSFFSVLFNILLSRSWQCLLSLTLSKCPFSFVIPFPRLSLSPFFADLPVILSFPTLFLFRLTASCERESLVLRVSS